MEYEKIKQLMDDMGNSKLTNIDIEFPDGTKLSMKKDNIVINNESKSNVKEITSIETNNEEKHELNIKKDTNIVKSPMVGTFYAKPAPDKNAYVEVGASVKKGDTLCIIEAMKLMNEIESEFTGKIVKTFVKDGETVEYGTPLFKIDVSE